MTAIGGGGAPVDERSSVDLIDALARIWSKIRTLHPGVPGVVLLAAPAAHGTPKSLGHFAPLRWRGPRGQGNHIHEVLVVGEHLDRPVEDILGTLIHEAAHAHNFTRKIRDCSRSQYHNHRFKAAAELLGLQVTKVKHYGYAHTTLLAGTLAMYEEEIAHLKRTLIHRRRPILPQGQGPPAGEDGNDNEGKAVTRSRKAICKCTPPFIIRVSKATIDRTTITCGRCGEVFALA